MQVVRHVAIIMDGNGRWAERQGMPRWRGHEAGVGAVRRIAEAACREEIAALTLFAFSTENWKRPATEVNILFSLFRRYLVEARNELADNGIRVSAVGRRDRLSPAVRASLEETETITRDGARLHLRLAIDYGSRGEMAEAARTLAFKVQRGEMIPDQIDEIQFGSSLSSSDLPDPDLIIRTAGECRLSNFLLWHAAYSELYFSPKLWPDYGAEDLAAALAAFRSRTRRYGALPRSTGTIG